MFCPKCGEDSWKVKSSWRSKKNGYIIRNRICNHCHKSIKTIEILHDDYTKLKVLVDDFRKTVNRFLKNKPRYM